MKICVANVADLYWTRIAGQADSVFKEHHSPLNQALKGLGRDYYKFLIKKARYLLKKIKQVAKTTRADFGYLMATLLDGRDTWPITGKLALGLDIVVDLLVRSRQIPKYKVNVPKGESGDDYVDNAIRRLAQWVETYFTKELRNDLYKQSLVKAKELQKKVKIDLSPSEMAQYLMIKFAERMRKGVLILQNSGSLRRIIRLLIKKRELRAT